MITRQTPRPLAVCLVGAMFLLVTGKFGLF